MKRCVGLLWLMLFAVLAGGARAQSSGSATISNVRFQLTDLDPNDGIAPSVSFIANPDSRSVADWSRRVLYYESDLKYTQPALTPVGIDSHWTNPATSPASHIDLAASVLGRSLAALTMQASAQGLYTGGEYFASARAWSGYVDFILSPMTAMSLLADTVVHATAGPLSAPGLFAGGAGGVVMQLGSPYNQQNPVVSVTQFVQFGQAAQEELSRTLILAYSNELARPSDHFLLLEAAANVSNDVFTLPPPVPEPASYAMLGAGLLLLGARLRRRGARPCRPDSSA